jgi:hypothetical protein
LLDAACDELQDIRRYLTLRNVIWQSFVHRDERGILMPYLQLRHRQAFQDGVRFALLLVAVRRALINEEPGSSAIPRQPGHSYKLRRAATIPQIATAIAGESQAVSYVPSIISDWPGEMSEPEAPPVTQSLRTRRWPGQCRTRSWQAAYNLACVYAVIAQHRIRELQTHKSKSADERPAGETDTTEEHLCHLISRLVCKVITSLNFAINNPECEMDRPWNWINCDPDFSCLRSGDEEYCTKFNDFLATQKQRDYPAHAKGLAYFAGHLTQTAARIGSARNGLFGRALRGHAGRPG